MGKLENSFILETTLWVLLKMSQQDRLRLNALKRASRTYLKVRPHRRSPTPKMVRSSLKNDLGLMDMLQSSGSLVDPAPDFNAIIQERDTLLDETALLEKKY
jgi:hypothetical protein